MDIKSFEPLFGSWRTDAVIGVGSFGKVYRAYCDMDGRRYYSAIKHISLPADEAEVYALRSEGMDDKSVSSYYSELVKDIGAESRMLNELRGEPNVVNYEESIVLPKANGVGYDIFIRMELLESLPKRMSREPMTYEKTLDLGIDILKALEACERKGIIHRDIKPDNIFVSPDGRYKLGDFGIARSLEKTTTFMSKKGTYNYMAPEVYKGEKYGASCDIYSLGLVLYRLMNKGRLPFVPGTEASATPAVREMAMQRRLAGEKLPAPCDANHVFAGIISRACAFDPADRYSSPAEMRRYLENLKNMKEIPVGVAPGGDDGGTVILNNDG